MDQLELLIAKIESDIPVPWQPWPGGYTEEIESVVLDAVFSIQARYSRREGAGPRGVVERWRTHRGVVKCDDLRELAVYDGKDEELADIVANRARGNRGRTLKAGMAASAAAALVHVGVRSAAEFASADATTTRRAWRSVHGLADVTWEYFSMLLGHPGVKADIMICRFVADAVRPESIKAERAHDLVMRAASELNVSPTELDHAIWSYQRAQPA